MRSGSERLVRGVLLAVALSAISSLLLIAAFIFKEGLPFILKVGVRDFLFAAV